MGFGLLLIGYVFSFVTLPGLGGYAFAGMLIGGFIMYLGLCELRKYSPVFIYSLIVSILIIICSVFKCGVWLNSWLDLGIGLFGESVGHVLDWIKFALYALFDFSMLYGIADLSSRVDYPDTRKKAFTNMIYVSIFVVFQLIMLMPFISAVGEENVGVLMTLLVIVQVIYTVFNALLIFKCYAMICPAGQEDMPRKPSRFAFVNRFREIRDAKEEKAIDEMKNYYEDKLRKKNAKKKSKKKKK